MPERCIEWVGEKCVKWTIDKDDKVTAEINYGQCPVNIRKQIEKDIGRAKGFKFKIKE